MTGRCSSLRFVFQFFLSIFLNCGCISNTYVSELQGSGRSWADGDALRVVQLPLKLQLVLNLSLKGSDVILTIISAHGFIWGSSYVYSSTLWAMRFLQFTSSTDFFSPFHALSFFESSKFCIAGFQPNSELSNPLLEIEVFFFLLKVGFFALSNKFLLCMLLSFRLLYVSLSDH